VCGYREKSTPNCSSCGAAELQYKGYGTKQVEAHLKKLFPTAIIARFDSDNLESETLNKKYIQLKNKEVDIIVGTQMIAKGLDLPKLELVAIPGVDSLITLPDYSATQKFFQLVYQALGRVGRHRPGQVVLQTYDVKNPLLLSAIKKDYGGFFNNEINERKIGYYPPFAFLLSLSVTRKSSENGLREATKMSAAIKSKFADLDVLGPAPAFREKGPGGWKWQIVVKSTDRTKLVTIARSLPPRWQFDLDPLTLLS
jgi:primosomal protein N' (replication factor Y)